MGTIEPGVLADMLILDRDPMADISILQRRRHLSAVIKDGKQVNLNGHPDGYVLSPAAY